MLNSNNFTDRNKILIVFQVDNLPNFPSKVLATLFAVSSKLCDEKFELKINDVR